MKSFLEFIFENLRENPEIKPDEKLSRKELTSFLKLKEMAKESKDKLECLGLGKLGISEILLKVSDFPKLENTTWVDLSRRHLPFTLDHLIYLWCWEFDKKINESNLLQVEIGEFENWLNEMTTKYTQIDFRLIDVNLLLNIWVDYKVVKLTLEHINQMPILLRQNLDENLIELTNLIFNAIEFFDRDIDGYKEGKAIIYGQKKETSKFRVSLNQFKELEGIIFSIKDINKRFLNKGIEVEHLSLLRKEIGKINHDFFQMSTIRKLKDVAETGNDLSERLLFDLLNDFLVALGFKQAITEEDEMNYLKREGATLDTIRQMKKRLILGISK
jgi:hypothetical protein